MSALALLGAGLVVLGSGFFGVGALGLVRFPDAFSRLQGVLKAAALGWSLTVLGLALQASSWLTALKLLSIGVLLLVTGATGGQGVGRLLWRGTWRG